MGKGKAKREIVGNKILGGENSSLDALYQPLFKDNVPDSEKLIKTRLRAHHDEFKKIWFPKSDPNDQSRKVKEETAYGSDETEADEAESKKNAKKDFELFNDKVVTYLRHIMRDDAQIDLYETMGPLYYLVKNEVDKWPAVFLKTYKTTFLVALWDLQSKTNAELRTSKTPTSLRSDEAQITEFSDINDYLQKAPGTFEKVNYILCTGEEFSYQYERRPHPPGIRTRNYCLYNPTFEMTFPILFAVDMVLNFESSQSFISEPYVVMQPVVNQNDPFFYTGLLVENVKNKKEKQAMTPREFYRGYKSNRIKDVYFILHSKIFKLVPAKKTR